MASPKPAPPGQGRLLFLAGSLDGGHVLLVGFDALNTWHGRVLADSVSHILDSVLYGMLSAISTISRWASSSACRVS